MKYNAKLAVLSLLFPLISCLNGPAAFAQASETSPTHEAPKKTAETVHISADSAEFEPGRGVYRGRVTLQHNGIHIDADELIVFESKGEVTHIEAIGQPGRFIHHHSEAEKQVNARAGRIHYRIADQQLTLKNSAHIEHGGSSVSSEEIIYNGQRRTISADSSGGTKPQRVNMVLQAAELSQDKSSAEDTKSQQDSQH